MVKVVATLREPKFPSAGVWGWILPVLVVAATFCAFIPVLDAEFVNWDDDRNFLTNPYYRGLSFEHLKWMFTTTKMGHYQPLSWLTLGADYTLWKMEAPGYHRSNVFFHCAVALALYFLSLRLFRVALPEEVRHAPVATRWCALIAALFHTAHPFRVESVAWVTERRDVLSGVFFVLTLVAYLKARAGERLRIGWYLASIGLLILSLLSKAWGMTIPAILIVLDVYPLRRLGPAAGGWFGSRSIAVWLQKAPFVLLAAMTALKAKAAQAGQFDTLKTLEQHGIVARAGQAFYGLGFYLYKTLVPIGYALSREVPYGFTGLEGECIAGAAVVLSVTLGLLVIRRRWPAGLTVWICYVAVLSPVLGIAQSGPQIVKDSYSYLCCLGWGMLLGGALLSLHARGAKANGDAKPVVPHDGAWLPTAFVLVAISGLGYLTWKQAGHWKNSKALWAHALMVTPNSFNANTNMGTILRREGDVQGAIEHYQRAIRAKPDNATSYYNLGNALKKLNRFEEAAQQFLTAIEHNPLMCPAHFNLANTYSQQLNRPEDALRHYEEALRVKRLPRAPASATRIQDIQYCIALELNRLGRQEEARVMLNECLRRDPEHKQALQMKHNMGW